MDVAIKYSKDELLLLRKQRDEPPEVIRGIPDVIATDVLEPVSHANPLDADDISRLWQAGTQTKGGKAGAAGRATVQQPDGWSRGMKTEEKGLWDGDGGGEAADFELSDFAAAAEKFRMDTADKNYGSDAVIARVEDDPLERLLREDAAAVAERQALGAEAKRLLRRLGPVAAVRPRELPAIRALALRGPLPERLVHVVLDAVRGNDEASQSLKVPLHVVGAGERKARDIVNNFGCCAGGPVVGR